MAYIHLSEKLVVEYEMETVNIGQTEPEEDFGRPTVGTTV